MRTKTRRALYALTEFLFDHVFGIETRKREPGIRGNPFEDATAYTPLGIFRPLKSIRALNVRAGDVFLDLGCGKGRALALASLFPFTRIIGVELGASLAAHALASAKRLQGRPFSAGARDISRQNHLRLQLRLSRLPFWCGCSGISAFLRIFPLLSIRFILGRCWMPFCFLFR